MFTSYLQNRAKHTQWRRDKLHTPLEHWVIVICAVWWVRALHWHTLCAGLTALNIELNSSVIAEERIEDTNWDGWLWILVLSTEVVASIRQFEMVYDSVWSTGHDAINGISLLHSDADHNWKTFQNTQPNDRWDVRRSSCIANRNINRQYGVDICSCNVCRYQFSSFLAPLQICAHDNSVYNQKLNSIRRIFLSPLNDARFNR